MADQGGDPIRTGKVARGTLYNMVSKVVYLLCAYAINIFIGRYLGPEKYGIFGVVFALTNIAYLFLTSGLPQATSKYIGGSIANAMPVLKSALSLQLPWSLFLFVLFFAGAGPISSIILQDGTLALYIRMAALTIVPLALFNVYQGALLGSAQFGKEALGLILRSATRLLVVIALVLGGFGIEGAIAGYICAAFAGAIIARAFCKFPASDISFDKTRLVKFAVPLIISGGMITLLGNMDSLFVKRIVGHNDQVGFYVAAASLAHAVYHLFTAFGVILLPSVAGAFARGGRQSARGHVYQAFRYILLFAVPVAAVIACTSEQLITLFYGEGYSRGGVPLAVLVFGNLMLALAFALNACIAGMSRPWAATSFYAAAVIVGILSNLILVSRYGLIGAALAVSLANAVCAVSCTVYICSMFPGFIGWKSLFRIFFSTAVVFFAAFVLPVSGFMLLLWYGLLLAGYVVLLCLTREVTGEDLQVLRDIFHIRKTA